MPADTFDYAGLLRPGLPPAAAKWAGFPKYNFVGGHNDADSVPVEDLIAAATSVLRREGRTLATYGLESGAQGYRPLREFIAGKLADGAGIACSPDEILITSGSLQGLDLVNQVLLSPGDTVIVEQMTYGGAITRLQRLGVNIVGVAVDRDGLSSAGLEAALEDLKQRGITPKYIYTIPTVQNPTATVMSEARRAELLGLSQAYGVPIFEDECYADLVWDGKRPRALRGMAGNDRVIHIGSFSKTIAPALRLGYLVAGWPLMSRILGVKSDAGSGALEQMVLAEYCRDRLRRSRPGAAANPAPQARCAGRGARSAVRAGGRVRRSGGRDLSVGEAAGYGRHEPTRAGGAAGGRGDQSRRRVDDRCRRRQDPAAHLLRASLRADDPRGCRQARAGVSARVRGSKPSTTVHR